MCVAWHAYLRMVCMTSCCSVSLGFCSRNAQSCKHFLLMKRMLWSYVIFVLFAARFHMSRHMYTMYECLYDIMCWCSSVKDSLGLPASVQHRFRSSSSLNRYSHSSTSTCTRYRWTWHKKYRLSRDDIRTFCFRGCWSWGLRSTVSMFHTDWHEIADIGIKVYEIMENHRFIRKCQRSAKMQTNF